MLRSSLALLTLPFWCTVVCASHDNPRDLNASHCPTGPTLPLKAGRIEYWSQVHQDKIVIALLAHKRHGYFLDLAANDPRWLSNSYTLEQYFGWRGICIDGNPKYVARYATQRNCTAIHAAVDSTPDVTVEFRIDNGVLGGIVGSDLDNKPLSNNTGVEIISLQTQTLESILRKHCAPTVIDYYSLDVEGAEWRVMKHFPFNAYQFRVITIERPQKNLRELLVHHKYVYVGKTGGFGETVWLHESTITSSRRMIWATLQQLAEDGMLVVPDEIYKRFSSPVAGM